MITKTLMLHKIQQLQKLIYFTAFNFFEDDCPYRASALAFTSLLALIPLMTVAFIILSAFPVFHNFSAPIKDFIFDNFVPTTGKIIQNYLGQFVNQVPRLSILGVSFLFITAILLMITIEHAMNKIWKVENARKKLAAFLLYWAILSLGPVFLGLSLAASSYFLSFVFFQQYIPFSNLLNIIPIFFSLTGFILLYYVVPNCKVRFYEALWGGVVATLLFEAAKGGFGLYLTYYNSYQLLYGAFATIPIFLIWIYWVWLITLLGAEVSYAASVYHKHQEGQTVDGFSHALLWLYLLWISQKDGKALTSKELLQYSNQPFAVNNTLMLQELQRLKLINKTDQEQYLLSRDLNEISLYWLSQNLIFQLPTSSPLEKKHALYLTWERLLAKKEQFLTELLQMSVAEFFMHSHDKKD